MPYALVVQLDTVISFERICRGGGVVRWSFSALGRKRPARPSIPSFSPVI